MYLSEMRDTNPFNRKRLDGSKACVIELECGTKIETRFIEIRADMLSCRNYSVMRVDVNLTEPLRYLFSKIRSLNEMPHIATESQARQQIIKKSPTENDNELGLLSQSNRPTEWIDNTISGGFENYSSKFEQQVYGEFNMENDYFLRSDIIRDILNSSNFIWLPLQQIKKSLKLERHANWTSADQSGTTFGCEWCWIQFSTNKSRCRSHEEVFHFERKWHTRESTKNSDGYASQYETEADYIAVAESIRRIALLSQHEVDLCIGSSSFSVCTNGFSLDTAESRVWEHSYFETSLLLFKTVTSIQSNFPWWRKQKT